MQLSSIMDFKLTADFGSRFPTGGCFGCSGDLSNGSYASDGLYPPTEPGLGSEISPKPVHIVRQGSADCV